MGSKIKIAIIDSGINRKLAQVVKCENELIVDESNSCRLDFTKQQATDYSHGTICSLIIEKYCPECVFDSIRILDDKGKGYIERIVPALEWCIQNDIKIANLSLGTTHFRDNEKLNKVINKYVNKGLIIVAAISNTGYFTSPASFTNVIGVASKESYSLYVNDYHKRALWAGRSRTVMGDASVRFTVCSFY